MGAAKGKFVDGEDLLCATVAFLSRLSLAGTAGAQGEVGLVASARRAPPDGPLVVLIPRRDTLSYCTGLESERRGELSNKDDCSEPALHVTRGKGIGSAGWETEYRLLAGVGGSRGC